MTVAEFETQINTDGYTLVDFWAPWCGPCKVIGPIVEKISDENEGLKLVKVEVDDSAELSSIFGIRSIPTLILMKGGEAIGAKIGVQSKDNIQTWINENMN
jgi:thioredoxin 1